LQFTPKNGLYIISFAAAPRDGHALNEIRFELATIHEFEVHHFPIDTPTMYAKAGDLAPTYTPRAHSAIENNTALVSLYA
jgi:hypothetical protein